MRTGREDTRTALSADMPCGLWSCALHTEGGTSCLFCRIATAETPVPTAAPPAHSAHLAQALLSLCSHSLTQAKQQPRRRGSASGPRSWAEWPHLAAAEPHPSAGPQQWQRPDHRGPDSSAERASAWRRAATSGPGAKLNPAWWPRHWGQDGPSPALPDEPTSPDSQRLPGNHPHSGLIASPSRRQVLPRSPSPAVHFCTTWCIISTTSTSLLPVPRLSQQTHSGPPGPRAQ